MNCLTAAVKGFRAEFILHTKDIEAGCEKPAYLQSLLSTVLLNTGCSTSCYQFVLCSCLKKGGVFLGFVFWVCVCVSRIVFKKWKKDFSYCTIYRKKGEGGSSFDMYYVLDFRDKKTILLI